MGLTAIVETSISLQVSFNLILVSLDSIQVKKPVSQAGLTASYPLQATVRRYKSPYSTSYLGLDQRGVYSGFGISFIGKL